MLLSGFIRLHFHMFESLRNCNSFNGAVKKGREWGTTQRFKVSTLCRVKSGVTSPSWGTSERKSFLTLISVIISVWLHTYYQYFTFIIIIFFNFKMWRDFWLFSDSIYIHTYISIYIYGYVYPYIYKHICTYIFIYTYIHTYLYVYIYTHIFICIHIHTYTVYIDVCTCMYVLEWWDVLKTQHWTHFSIWLIHTTCSLHTSDRYKTDEVKLDILSFCEVPRSCDDSWWRSASLCLCALDCNLLHGSTVGSPHAFVLMTTSP